MNWSEGEERGQAYILAAFILSAFIIAAMYSIRTASSVAPSGTFEMGNLKRGLAMAYANGIYNNDLNWVMDHTSKEFRKFYIGKLFTLKLLFTAYDNNGHYILGNYWGQKCAYSTSVVSGTIEDGTTKVVPKETLLNDYSLTFCGKKFNLKNKFQYWAELHRGTEALVK